MKNETKDTKIQKKVETRTKYYSRENSQGTCPKCKSDDSKYRGSCPVDFTDYGDGEAIFDIFLTCKKCGLEFVDVWEARYYHTEGQEEVEKTTKKKQPIDEDEDEQNEASNEDNGGESDE